jgi:HAD superfamily hydrolase (TIGR01549 family)
MGFILCNFSGVEWVFLDMGSVLIDETKGDVKRYIDVQAAMAGLGVFAEYDEIEQRFESAYTERSRNPFGKVLESYGLDENLQAVVYETAVWRRDYEILMHGAVDLLEALKDRYKLGIIANQSPGSEDRLRGHGIRDYFSFVLASAEEGISKPDPAIFLRALDRAGCSPEKAVMVGDRIDNDVRPAKQLGLKTIRLVSGVSRFQEPVDELDTADFTAYSLEEIAGVLSNGRGV